MSSSTSSHSTSDRVFSSLMVSSALVVGLTLLFIVSFLFYESLPVLLSGQFIEMLRTTSWYPSEGNFGLLPMLLGSLAVALGALAISLPMSVFCAVFMVFFAPSFVKIFMRRLLEVLAGIPSVIFGLWGLVELVPVLRELRAPGTSLFAAALVLSLMIMPTMTLIIERSLRNFPTQVFNNALALGMNLDRVVLRLVIPASRKGILAGAVLGFGRAIGETMAVLMVAGNVVQIPTSLFDSVRTMTANIALEMAYAMDEHRAALFVCGLILCAIVTLVIVSLDTAEDY